MGNIGDERRRIKVLPARDPNDNPPAQPVAPAEPSREPAPAK
jgi:hypothetical protein